MKPEQKNIDVHALATAVARYIPGWKAHKPHEDNDRYSQLLHSSGATVGMYWDSYRGRLDISGSFPRDETGRAMRAADYGLMKYTEKDPEIGCSPTRPPEQIAREITRRLLPAYLPLYEAATKRLAERKAYRSAKQQHAEKYAAALGVTARNDTVHLNNDLMWGDIEINSEDGSARVKLDLKATEVEKLVKILSEAIASLGKAVQP